MRGFWSKMNKTPLRKHLLPALAFVLANAALSLIILKSPVIFQEGNPLNVAIAVCKLEFLGKDVVKFSNTPEKYIFKAGYGLEPLTNHLAEEGWKFGDQVGAGVSYEKEDIFLWGRIKMFTRYFTVMEVRQKTVKEILRE